MKALVGAFNQEKALVGAFSVIVQPVVEPIDRFTALILIHSYSRQQWCGAGRYHCQGFKRETGELFCFLAQECHYAEHSIDQAQIRVLA